MDQFNDPNEKKRPLESKKGFQSPFKNNIPSRERKTSGYYQAPTKEGATTGRYACVGDVHGSGYKTPVGKFTASGIESGPIPMKSSCHNPNDLI